MKILKQKLIINKLDGSIENKELTHIYSEIGGFEKDGVYVGDHIQLGAGANVEDYKEIDMNKNHTIPTSLRPIVYVEEPEIEEPEDE